MTKGLDDKSVETLVVDLVQGITDVNQLNLAKANQRQAFFKALEERPALLTKVSKINEEHFFSVAIKKNPSYFVHLSTSQYTNELAQIYLFSRLSEKSTGRQAQATASPDVLVRKSLDDRIVFTYSYLSAEGDELYYLDKELQVPVSLKSNIMLTLKLEDAVEFINKLDTHITQLGEEKIKSVILDIIATQYKSYLNSYLNKNQIGYYTLCTSLNDVETGFIKVIGNTFKPYGISVSDFVIKSIAIPKDIQYKLEDQAFKIRQRRAEVEADAEFAKISLESYEAKLAIHNKYPETELTLTEYEKDLALKRYLTKVGRGATESVDRTIKLQSKNPKADSVVAKPEDIIPDIPTKPNIFRRVYFILAAVATFLSVILFSAAEDELGAAYILTGLLILGFGLVAAFNTRRFATIKVEPSIIDTDEHFAPAAPVAETTSEEA